MKSKSGKLADAELTGVGVSSNFFGSGGGLESRSLLLSFLTTEKTWKLKFINKALRWEVNLCRHRQSERAHDAPYHLKIYIYKLKPGSRRAQSPFSKEKHQTKFKNALNVFCKYFVLFMI